MYLNIVNLENREQLSNSFGSYHLMKFATFYEAEAIGAVDTSIPTLYVGHAFAKTLFPDLDILDNVLSPTEHWCFSLAESSMHFLKGLQGFLGGVPEMLTKGLRFTPVDPFFTPHLLPPADLPLDVVYVRGECVFYGSGREMYGMNLRVASCGVREEARRIYGAVTEAAKAVHVDRNGKIFSFFVESFGFDPERVERYIPFLIGLKDKNL